MRQDVVDPLVNAARPRRIMTTQAIACELYFSLYR